MTEVLSGEHVHLTAGEVHARAAVVLPEIARATVYGALGKMVVLGEVREVQMGGRDRRYGPNAAASRHHLVSTSCGSTMDVPDGSDAASAMPAEEDPHGFHGDHVGVAYRGTCADCATLAVSA